MAITGPSSFVPTVNEFLAHWLQTNTFLGVAVRSFWGRNGDCRPHRASRFADDVRFVDCREAERRGNRSREPGYPEGRPHRSAGGI